MFCKNCGNQVPDNLSFCSFCGTPLKTTPQMQNQETQVFNPIQQMPQQDYMPQQNYMPQQEYVPQQDFAPQPAPAPKKKKSPQKNNNNGVIIALIVLLIVIVIVLGVLGVVFLTKDDGDSGKKKDSEDSSSATSVSTTLDTNTTSAPDNKPDDQPAPSYLKATASDFDLFADLFASMCLYADNYHPKNVTAQNDVGLMLMDLFASTYYLCADEYGWEYPEHFDFYEDAPADPKGKFTDGYDGYYVYPADKIQWIAQNMFNLKLTESEGYIYDEYEGTEELVWYYDNGKYYSYIIATGMEGYYYCDITDSELRDDGKYDLKIDLYYSEMEMPDSFVCSYDVVAGIKEVDGTRIWSIDEWKFSN